MTNSYLGLGIYSVSEAANYVNMPYQSLYTWFGKGELFRSDFAETELKKSISFYDLIDVFVARHFRMNGVSLRYIRMAYEVLREDFGREHPFCHSDFFTGSGEIYIKLNDILSEVLTKQTFNENVIRDHLYGIEYDRLTRIAKKWTIRQGVVLDPDVSFGKPVLDSTRIPTYILAESYLSNERDAKFVAELFQVKPRDIMDAVAFESEMGGLKDAA